MKAAAVAVVFATLAAAGAVGNAQANRFVVTALVSDRTDSQLVNPWGLAVGADNVWWVANEARSSTTLYARDGRKQALTVQVPGGPTGVAFNGGNGFVVRAAGVSAPARFVYACEDGMVRAWSPVVPHGWSKDAEVVIDAGASAAVFRGITVAARRVYVTDFHNARVLVFDSRWRRVVRRGAFVDGSIPSWYAPFGIQAFGGRIFVTYAWRAPVDGNDAPTGGYVDEFNLSGRLIARVGGSKELDEPWGLALAPRGFGGLAGDLLVANFGSGRITVYAPRAEGWTMVGNLPVTIPGVWGIAFGAGGASGPRTTLFYAGGPHSWHGASEVNVHGVFGAVTARG